MIGYKSNGWNRSYDMCELLDQKFQDVAMEKCDDLLRRHLEMHIF